MVKLKNREIVASLASGTVILIFLILVLVLPSRAATFPVQIHHTSIVVIKPTFTFAAYQPRGFYDYYRKFCNTGCLTVRLQPAALTDTMYYAGSENALKRINSLRIADVVTDEQVTQNPTILSNYAKVIVLHNEYVTQSEYYAITHHHNVLYLYPNALYALVSYNSSSGTITLDRGHGYKGINDAFGWPPSMSTKDEYNTSCKDWRLEKTSNGSVLDCYPEFDIMHDARLISLVQS